MDKSELVELVELLTEHEEELKQIAEKCKIFAPYLEQFMEWVRKRIVKGTMETFEEYNEYLTQYYLNKFGVKPLNEIKNDALLLTINTKLALQEMLEKSGKNK